MTWNIEGGNCWITWGPQVALTSGSTSCFKSDIFFNETWKDSVHLQPLEGSVQQAQTVHVHLWTPVVQLTCCTLTCDILLCFQEHHLQRAISAQQVFREKMENMVIPVPEAQSNITYYDRLYRGEVRVPKQLIHIQREYSLYWFHGPVWTHQLYLYQV